MEKIIIPLMPTNQKASTNKFAAIRNSLYCNSWIILFAAISVIFVAIGGAKTASAASLYFSPSSGSRAVGTTLSASIYVSSADQAMNAASGVISFPQDKLEVTSLSKTGSIFTLWVQEPSFSNSAGMVNFEGIVLNPGFTGASGKVITVNFRIKAAGVATLNFSSGSALANDGKGTNILKDLGNAAFSLGGAVPATVPEATTPGKASTPGAPAVSSPTHTESNKWYANNNPKFIWELPKEITGVRLSASKFPQTIPTVMYTPPISSKELSNLEDGVWYFHARLRNNVGWGEVSHFRFQIDTKPPEPFFIKFVDGKETINPRPTVIFDTTDSLSGIGYYKVKIGEGDFFTTTPDIIRSNPYTLHPQASGKRTILVQAFDKAENYTVAAEEFIILPLESPMITDWQRELDSGELLIVKGITKYPDVHVVVWLQHENEDAKSQTTKSDGKGNFVFIAEEKSKDGVYKFWAEIVDARGAKSLPSERLTTVVKRPAFLQIGSWAVSLLAVVVPIVALVFILLFLIWYGWHKFSMFRKKMKKEVHEAELVLHKAFDLLKDDIREQVKLLEKTRTKRQLTEEEEKIIKQLKKDLDDAEKFVRKEIEDIEKAVK